MKCDGIQEMMPDLASGLMEVTPEVSGHLTGCGACAAKLEEFQADHGVAGRVAVS